MTIILRVRRSHQLLMCIAALSVVPLAGCSTDDADTAAPTGDCPTGPVPVVVTVDQWGDIVKSLGGDCIDLTTIITGSSADPHDYEPTPSDGAKFDGAELVVMNGLDYDSWADKALDALDTQPAVVNGGDVVGLEAGDNPHIWYGPTFVRKVSQAVTDELSKLSPDASTYFAERQDEWQTSMQPYDDEIARIKALAADKLTYGATESVFDYMAQAVGLKDATPKGYRNASANGSEPAPADVNEFEQALRDKMMDVLIDNTQTEGPGPEQLRSVAKGASVPVVPVTETVPPGTDSFVAWQVRQLESLASALGSVTAAVRLDDVAIIRGGRTVWSDGSFAIPHGAVVGVIGPNGSGKTTLLEMILGVLEPSAGRIEVFDAPPQRGNRRIGYVPQNYTAAVGEGIRCRDLVALGVSGDRWGLGRLSGEARDRVDAALASVGAADYANRRMSRVSGGQQQRVAIAQALVHRPELLLLDEPLANLDMRNQQEVVTLLGGLAASGGMTVLIVAHDLNPLLSILTGAVYLLDGHPHFGEIGDVVDEELLSHLYGTTVKVVRTAQGDLFTRNA